jgi:hypothetical protein
MITTVMPDMHHALVSKDENAGRLAIAPASSARVAAIDAYRAWLPAASGPTAMAVISAVVVATPTLPACDGPAGHRGDLRAAPSPGGYFICYWPGKKSLIAAAAASLAVSGASPQAVSIVRSRL